MKTYKFICILACIIAACNMNFAQPNCEYDVLFPVPQGKDGGSIPLPDLDDPDGPVYSRTGNEDYRMLYFLHGLNGQTGAWSKADAACLNGYQNFPARKVYTQRPDYYLLQKSFPEATSELISATRNLPWDLLPENYKRKDGMIIGHSQGGLVSRSADMYYSLPQNRHERNFGGIVTVTTANQGAQILSNELGKPQGQGYITNLISSFVEELSEGPISDIENSGSFFVRMIFDLADGSSIKDKLLQFITLDLGGVLIANNLPPITKDCQVGSSFLENELNTYTPIMEGENETVVSTNIVAFYAIRDTLQFKPEVKFMDFDHIDKSVQPNKQVFKEKTIKNLPVPISLATMTFFTGDVNESETFNSLNDEWVVPVRAHTMRMEYASQVETNQNHVNFHRKQRNKYINSMRYLPPILLPPVILAANNAAKAMERAQARKNAWQRGVNFLDNFDRSYRVMIGAMVSEIEVHQFSGCNCVAIDDLNGITYDFGVFERDNNGISCEALFLQNNPEFSNLRIFCNDYHNSGGSHVWKHKDSDGVVLAESQMDIPQATFPPQLRSNSTHMSIRNDINTKTILESVFEGEVGLFFKTKEKD